MYVVGIDENGFGPIVGPLVVTAAVFELKEPYTQSYLWDRLRAVISKTTQEFPEKITVYNSKEVFKSKLPKSYKVLESTVLNFFELLSDRKAKEFREFIGEVSLGACECVEDAAEDAAFELCHNINLSLPLWTDNKAISHQKRLKEELAKAEIKALKVKSLIVCPGQFNSYLNRTDSKFHLNWLQFGKLIRWVIETVLKTSGTQSQDIAFPCGKIGGQKNYLSYLKHGFFKNFDIKRLVEKKEISTYHLSSDVLDFNLSFIESGDIYHFPIALASLFGKYIREVFMHHQNQVFKGWDSSVKPASGYRNSSTKIFIKDTEDLRKRMGLPDRCFLRQK
ncbi:MAG TPA: hypothetical protein VIH20_04540 [Candidatus Subteraquimicrobiales bacterium]